MKKLALALAILISGGSHTLSLMERCECCRSCTTDYECEVSCERDKGSDCAEYSALEEIVEAYQADLREYEQSERELEELWNEGK